MTDHEKTENMAHMTDIQEAVADAVVEEKDAPDVKEKDLSEDPPAESESKNVSEEEDQTEGDVDLKEHEKELEDSEDDSEQETQQEQMKPSPEPTEGYDPIERIRTERPGLGGGKSPIFSLNIGGSGPEEQKTPAQSPTVQPASPGSGEVKPGAATDMAVAQLTSLTQNNSEHLNSLDPKTCKAEDIKAAQQNVNDVIDIINDENFRNEISKSPEGVEAFNESLSYTDSFMQFEDKAKENISEDARGQANAEEVDRNLIEHLAVKIKEIVQKAIHAFSGPKGESMS